MFVLIIRNCLNVTIILSMKEHFVNKQEQQSGFAHLIAVTAVLGIFLVDALVYIFYQLFH